MSFYKFNEIKKIYLKQFTNLGQLSLINILFSKSNDITIEFKDIFFEYILMSFYNINKIKSCNSLALFIIINKILFFNYEKTQECLQNILQKKISNLIWQNSNLNLNEENNEKIDLLKKSFDEELFENNQIILKTIIFYQIILCKNPILINRYKYISLLSKNIIQFFQLLGEGHNKVFQNLLVNGTNGKFSYINNNNYKNNNNENNNNNNNKIIDFHRSTKNINNNINNNNNIYMKENIENIPYSILSVLCSTLNKILKFITTINENLNGELPYDKLITLLISIVDCIIEFFQGTLKSSYINMYNQVKNCFENMKNVILLKIPENNNKRKNFIIIIKITILDLIISLIEEGISDDNDINNLKDIMINFQPFELYNEIKICFEFIYKKYENFYLGIGLDNIKIIERFKELYKFNYNFQTSIELKLSFKIFYYLKILMEVYGRSEVNEFFNHLNKKYKETLEQEKEVFLRKKDKNNNDNNNDNNNNNIKNENNKKKSSVFKEENINNNNNRYSKFTHIRSIRSPIVKNQNNPSINFSNLTSNTNFPLINNNNNNNNQTNNQYFNQIKHTRTLHSHPLRKSMTKILHKTLSTKSKENDIILISEKISLNKINYFIYIFLKQIITRIQIRNEANESARDFSIFVIPPLCLLLSKSTKKNFFDNVDRETVANKILSLIEQTDYFIYEMLYNKLRMNNFNKFSKILCNLNIKYFEYINYALIIYQNFLLVFHFYSVTSIENKHKIYLDTFILCIFQLVFILIVLTIYFLYKFKLKYKHNIMKIYKVKFIYHKNLTENIIFENEKNLLENLGNNLTYINKLYTLFQSIVLNEEINIFIFSFILIIAYLLMSNGIFLAIPLLFIANLNDLLYGIIYALRLNIFQLLFVLLFMYLLVYLFTWFAFLYFSQLFEFSELYNIKLDTNVDEKLCSSLIQCFLTMLSYGVRSGGGIGDVIPMLSYKANPWYFIAGFFFVVFFHIIVVIIMINLLFGIIADSFVVLKNKIYKIEEDKKNICYICQITRDSALNKNINFNMHVNNIHNIWNYVFFIAYLHFNNERNFKSLETFVWEEILQNHTSWLPIGEEYCKADLENY